MTSPITELVIITAIAATALVVTVVAYLVVLARLGRPLTIDFSGYGVSLKVGPKVVMRDHDVEGDASE